MEKLKKKYPNSKILLMFYGGSKVYGCQNEYSDTDIIAVLDGENGLGGFVDGKTDYLVIGKEDFIKAHELSDDVNEEIILFADSILSTLNKDNLLYLDDSFKETYEVILNKDWKKWIPNYLKRIIPYIRMYSNNNSNCKKEYHIYRIRAMLDQLDQTGSFSLEMAEPYKSKMIEYKNHYQALPVKDDELKDLIAYFTQYAERKK